MKRENGFYWVRTGSDWTIGLWDIYEWSLVVDDRPYSDKDIDEIGDRIEPPKGE